MFALFAAVITVGGGVACAPGEAVCGITTSDSLKNARRDAVRQAFAWMVRTAQQPSVLLEYGSDFMEFHYELMTSAADPDLREMATKEGRAVAERYLAALGPNATDAEQAIDIISAVALLPEFQLESGALRAKAARASRAFPYEVLYGLRPGETSRDPEVLCDAIISLHFAHRAGLPDGSVLDWALTQAAGYRYQLPSQLTEDDQIDQDNLASHIVYVVSDYGRLSLAECPMTRHRQYMLASMDRLIADEDVEMVAEFVDSLRIMGLGDEHPSMDKAIRWLLTTRNPDGSFGDPEWEDIYDRYHATWTALNALRGFVFQGKGPLHKAWPCVPEALERAALRP